MFALKSLRPAKFRCFRIVERRGGVWFAGVLSYLFITLIYLLHHTVVQIYMETVCVGPLLWVYIFSSRDCSGYTGQLFF